MVFELSGATIGTKSHSKLAMLVMSCEITDLAFPCAAICLVDAAGLQRIEQVNSHRVRLQLVQLHESAALWA